MKEKLLQIILISSVTCLLSIGQSINGNNVQANEIKELERKLEYLKQKKELDAQLQKIQDKLEKLNNDYPNINKPSSTKGEVNKAAEPKKTPSNTITSKWILMSLVKSDGGVALMGCCGNSQKIKFAKDGADWTAKNERVGYWSVVKPGADKTLTMEDFPPNWVINGTWTFGKKKGSECKIHHEDDENLMMVWEC